LELFVNYRLMIATLVAGAILVGCGSLDAGKAASSTPLLTVAKPAFVKGSRNSSAGTLYVGDWSGVAAFDLSSYKLLRTYSGVDYAQGLAEDGSGNLYVTSSDPNEVLEFAAGSTKLIRTITKGISTPVDIAVGPNGDLYVSNQDYSGLAGDVSVYSPSGKLIKSITKGIKQPLHITFDSKGNLYVANPPDNDVLVYQNGEDKLTKAIQTVGVIPENLLVDSTGNLYVGGCSSRCDKSLVIEYGPLGYGTLRTIRSEIHVPEGLALDSSGNLYVADGQFGDERIICHIPVFPPGATEPSETITDGVRVAGSVLIDASDNLYVMNEGHGKGRSCNGPHLGSVTVYPPGSLQYAQEITQSIDNPVGMLIGQ
jgi:sugar lactone lactonase YvrE